MPKDTLRSLIENERIPEVSQERKAAMIERARLSFLHQPALENSESVSGQRWWSRRATVALATLCLLVALQTQTSNQKQSNGDPSWSEKLLESRALVQEVSTVFPGGINSIVLAGKDTEIVPAEGTPSANDLVVMEFQKNGETFRVIARSGVAVKLLLDSKIREIEPVVTGKDQVLLSSAEEVWSGDRRQRMYGYAVRAEKL